MLKRLLCAKCDIEFTLEKEYIVSKRNENPKVKFYCSKECEPGKIITLTCQVCQKLFDRMSSKLSANNFCSHSCSAKVSNSMRKLDKNRVKQYFCDICKTITDIPINAKSVCKNRKCLAYIPYRKEIRNILTRKRNCALCGNEFTSKQAKLCDLCRTIRRKEVGNKSVLSQNRRSKNEIYFAELCQKHFKDVKCNEPIFNGWDADVIIDDLKIAVLWNGNWHYQQIQKNISLKQIQSRDKIKIHQIENCGYIPYVIEDRGKYNPKFVEEQFEIFKISVCNLCPP